jgi:DHA2 family multidrug resistance protein
VDTPLVPPAPARAVEPPLINPWLTTLAVMFGTFMVVLDTTVVNVSLPYIAGSLSATISESTWVLTSYLAANAVILPMTGWLAAFFGRKRLLLISVVGFTIASMLCGIAPNLPALIVFRIIQGAMGGVMQPLSQAVLLEAFPPEDRGKAMGAWGLGIVVAPILGPVLGGWLTDHYSWRWIFYINIPIGVASVVLMRMYIFDPAYLKRVRERIDYLGLSLMVIGVGALQIMLDKGQEEDWFESRLIVTLFVCAVVGLVLFIRRELISAEPVLDLHIFKNRSFAVGAFLMTIVGFVLFGSLVLLPVLMQTLLGYPPVQAGIALAPRGMGSFVAMPLIGIATSKMDPRKLIAAGLILGAITLFWLAGLNLDAGYWDFFWPQVIQGFAMGMLFVPLTTVTMDAISREGMGNATSLFNLVRNIGSSVGIAVVTTLLTRSRIAHGVALGEHVSAYDASTRALFGQMQRMFQMQGPGAPPDLAAAAMLNGMIQRQAAMLSFIDAFRIMGVIFIVVLPLVLIMRRPKRGGQVVAAAD